MGYGTDTTGISTSMSQQGGLQGWPTGYGITATPTTSTTGTGLDTQTQTQGTFMQNPVTNTLGTGYNWMS